MTDRSLYIDPKQKPRKIPAWLRGIGLLVRKWLAPKRKPY